jgi:hypothetical protein
MAAVMSEISRQVGSRLASPFLELLSIDGVAI